MLLDCLFYYLVVAVTLYFICYIIEVVLSNTFYHLFFNYYSSNIITHLVMISSFTSSYYVMINVETQKRYSVRTHKLINRVRILLPHSKKRRIYVLYYTIEIYEPEKISIRINFNITSYHTAAASTTTSNDYYTDLKRFITHVCEEVMKITNALDIAGIPPRPQREQETLAPTQALTEQQDNINFSMAIADKVREICK
jgi:hypothetical protein